jgi:hypothetical protein
VSFPRSLPALAGLAAAALLAIGLGAAQERQSLRNGFVEVRSRHWVVHVPRDRQTRGAALAEAADRRLEAMAARLGVSLPNEPLQAWLHDSTATKKTLAGDDLPFTVLGVPADHREVHHLLDPLSGEITDPRGDALLLLRLAWGEPGAETLADAIARFAAGDFHGFPLTPYAARIAREEEPYPLREVLFPTSRDGVALSPLAADALAGAWVERLRADRGPEVLRLLWKAPLREEDLAHALGAPSWDALEASWKSALAAATPGAPPPSRLAGSLPFLKGITLSHEGFHGGDGYGSDTALAQLERMRKLGANSVTLVPYGFTRAPDETAVRWVGTDESDERVIRTLREARRLGLRTVLKPQLWARRRFTGDIAFADDAAFHHWLAAYRRFALHYARLAELEQVDVFVIGTEFGGLTPREADWRSLIADLRKVDRGRLTYAANWGAEFESLRFWDALDLLGVNFYYPLADPGELPKAGSPRVRALAARLEAMSRRHRKPLLFTEVGFPATAAAAVEPWKEHTAALDAEMQARCYRVIFDAFSRRPWLAGMSWWKWPSTGQGSADDPSFNPLGKPALGALAKGYGGR